MRPQAVKEVEIHIVFVSQQNPQTRYVESKTYVMDYIIIEPRVYQEMQALVKQLLERISRYRALTDPAAHSR